jgi:pyruvate dehydrogenase E2 component (dihydrolipoamide acetyltransferase)
MANNIILPKQGNTVESCIIVEWKVKPGDSVTAETAVCEVETDKATMEVAAGFAGTILSLLYKEGDDVPVMTPIAIVGAAGEKVDASAVQTAASGGPAAPGAVAAKAEDAPAAVRQPAAAAAPQASGSEAHGVSPRARNLAFKEGLDLAGLGGTGPEGRVIERDVRAGLESRPALTRAAGELARSGSPVPATGSGLGGRVTAADMTAPRPSAAASSASVPAGIAPSADFPGPFSETPIKGIRKRIADRMSESLQTTAQLTMNSSAKAERLLALRKRFKASDTELGLSGVTINDLVLFAVSRTLVRFPNMNAHKKDGKILSFDHVHLGVAVDTPRGLMVPVIRFADLLSLKGIAAEAKRLAAACKDETITPDELKGSTLTVTNLGSLGIESFTPVINIPEVAILGVCSILERVELLDGVPAAVPYLGLSLTIDHCVVDGSPAAVFLKELGAAIADIDISLAL